MQTVVDPEDPETKKKISKLAATLRYMRMFEDDRVAMFGYDGSEASLLLGYAIVQGKGQPIVLGPDVPPLEMQKAYFDNKCVGVVAPNEEFLEQLLSLPGNEEQGKGLESYCGYDPYSPVTPRFCIVCRNTPGVDGKTIQGRVGGTGREVDPVTGFSWQTGLPILCYTMDEVWVHLLYERMSEPSNYARNRRPWDV